MTKKNEEQLFSELDRLCIALSAKTYAEAAAILDVRGASFQVCIKRGGHIGGKLLESAINHGIRLEWIKEGILPMKLEKGALGKCAKGRYCTEVCPALEAIQRAASLIAHCPYMCRNCSRRE